MKPILISSIFDTHAACLYKFFLDSKLHTEITESEAIISNKIGGRFTAWDGYIKGEIVPLRKIKRLFKNGEQPNLIKMIKIQSLK